MTTFKSTFLFILLLFSINSVFSQSQFYRISHSSITDWQFSTNADEATGIVSNPGSLGHYHEANFSYSTFIQSGHFLEHNFFVQTPFLFSSFGGSYRKIYDDNASSSADVYGFGFGIGFTSLAIGYAANFLVSDNEETTLSDIGILYRPIKNFSLSYVVRNINAPSISSFSFLREQVVGLSIHPNRIEKVVLFVEIGRAHV